MELDDLLTAQSGVLTMDQAREFFDTATVQRRIHREWQSPHRGLVVTHNGDLDPDQRDWCAVLAAPPGTALWGGSAARWDGFRDRYGSGAVHVVQPVGSRRLSLPWVTVHWSSALSGADVHPAARPRRTRIPRSLVDLASDATNERRARAVLFMGVQQGLVTAQTLGSALRRRGPCRHHAVLLETIEDVAGGVRSVPEKDFDRIVRARRLPPPERQSVRRRPNGRWYLDALWCDYCLWVEVDGTHHRDVEQWEADLERTGEVVADGLRQIRFASWTVRRRPDEVGAVLERALRSGGWDGRRS